MRHEKRHALEKLLDDILVWRGELFPTDILQTNKVKKQKCYAMNQVKRQTLQHIQGNASIYPRQPIRSQGISG